MTARMSKRFVGFGFGPIQVGLMLLEASRSGNFEDLIAAEIDAELVEAVRGSGGAVTVNVAGADGIRSALINGIRIYNPRDQADRMRLVEAVRGADELATALPSVDAYEADGDASPAAVIAEGLAAERQRIVYTAENDNYAAEKLEAAIRARAHGCLSAKPRPRLDAGAPAGLDGSRFQALNTVIGKMSGSISSPEEMSALGLSPLVPGFLRCVLVEEFNRILISRIRLRGFEGGIRVFEEKDDLLPFEEAKLYGHNAVHAMLGYLAWLRGYTIMSRVRDDGELFALGRRAFLEESGAALIGKHASTGDPLFTAEGWKHFAEDLLFRMTNPFLHDSVERIARDPRRKLGYSDRLVGAMREALGRGIRPHALARGAAAAVLYALRRRPDPEEARRFLDDVWAGAQDDGLREACASMIMEALETPGPQSRAFWQV